MTPERMKAFDDAFAEVQSIKFTSKELVDQLEKGVSVRSAYEIVDKFWPPFEASKMKVNFTTTSEERNGHAILSGKFTPEMCPALGLTETREYFAQMFPFLSEKTKMVLESINSKGTDCDEAMDQYLCFRKSIARFCSMMNNNWVKDQTAVVCGNITTWDGLMDDVQSIEDGSYINWTDYPERILDAQKSIESNMLSGQLQQDNSIRWIGESCDQLIGIILVLKMFDEYTEKFL